MTKYTAEMEKIFEAVFSGSSIDPRTGKMVESDPAAFARADKALTKILEQVFKEKWLVKESETDSLSHMAGLIKFEELNAGPSSVKGAGGTAKPAPSSTMGESKKPTLGFAKIFEALEDFDPSQDSGQVEDGDDDFTDAQMGAGHEGDIAGSDEDMSLDGEEDPSQMGGSQMGDDQMDDTMMGGQQGGQMGGEMGDDDLGDDSALDFDLSNLDSFSDLNDGSQMGGQQGSQMGGEMGDQFAGDHHEQLDDEPMDDDDDLEGAPGGQTGGAMV